jgi:hypothetical protein
MENSDEDFEKGLEYIFTNSNINNTPVKLNRNLFYQTNTKMRTTRRNSLRSSISKTTARKTLKSKTTRPRTI